AETFDGWVPELADPNQAVAKGAALLGFQAELRARLDEAAQASGSDTGSPDVEQRVAEEMGVAVGTVQRVRDTAVTNVCSKAFGVKLLRHGADPGSDDPADHHIDHVILAQTPLPVEPDARTYGTTVHNQTSGKIELWEQSGNELSEEVAHNKYLGDGVISLPGTDPAGSPLTVSLKMVEGGILSARASHHSGSELEFEVEVEGGVTTQEEIEAGAARVAAMKRV
ncbi:MAG TPA: hypothetical protein VGV69_08875, partial [Solirubrobacterales bacterium]|nr:hypothetical protein [Solirubrobacterales bacterium]